MMFGSFGNPDHGDSVGIIRAALDAGINFVDTADMYSAGESEEIVGQAIAGRRDGLVLATKVHWPMGTDPNQRGNSRRWIIQACEDSLRRLGTDRIDLYQIHHWDSRIDIDETLGALTDLVRQGKVLYMGSSSAPPAALVEAQWVAERRQRERFVCEQPPYSLLARGIEAEVLPACQRYGMGVITYSPLSGGWLSGQWRVGEETPPSARARLTPRRYDPAEPVNAAKLRAATAFGDLAAEAGISLIHMAIAFVTGHPAVTSAIIGPRTRAHLDSQIGAAGATLDADVLDRIDAVVAPGTNLDPTDSGYVPPAVKDPQLRRRPAG